MHLFDLTVSGKLDAGVLDVMIQHLNKRNSDEAVNDKVDRVMGKILANKFLYPTIGAQPELTKQQEDELINKVKAENDAEANGTRKKNSQRIQMT